MEKRRFSIEDDFMKTRANTTLYGFMRCISTLDPQTMKDYLYKSDFMEKENIEIARKLCGSCTARTINNNINKLISEGLVKEELKNDRICYTFPFVYEGLYKLIELPLLKYLVNTRNDFGIQIYLYLLNKNYKKNYIFTIKELNIAFGFSEKSKRSAEVIKDNLQSLYNDGVIDYEESYQQIRDPSTGKTIPSPIKVLKFVATTFSQIRSKE